MSTQIEQAYIESAIPNREVSEKILKMIDAYDLGVSTGVASVNGQQGNVVLDADDLADGVTNKYYTEAKVNANVNPKILNLQLQINDKADVTLPSQTQYVYVNYLVGDDSSGNGSVNSPYKTIVAAMTSITDSSETKPYVIGLLASRQLETSDILVKPYVSIVGVGQKATYISAVGFNIKPHSLHVSTKSWNLLKNFYLGGSTGIDWDLFTITGNECNLVVENVSISGNFIFKGRSSGTDYLEIYSSNLSLNLSVDNTFSEIRNIKIVGTSTFTNTSNIVNLKSTIDNSTFKQDLTINNSNAELNSCTYPINSGLITIGTIVIDSYRGVPPVTRQVLSLNTTLNEYSEIGTPVVSEKYIRSFNNNSDWDLNIDIYELSILTSSHNKGINPQIQTFELNGANFEEVTCNTTIDSSGNVKIKIPQQSPDLRFNGKIILS